MCVCGSLKSLGLLVCVSVECRAVAHRRIAHQVLALVGQLLNSGQVKGGAYQ